MALCMIAQRLAARSRLSAVSLVRKQGSLTSHNDVVLSTSLSSKGLGSRLLYSTKSRTIYSLTLKRPNGERLKVSGNEDESILDGLNNSDHSIDGFGACDAAIACSTCHCVLDTETFSNEEDNLTNEEQDLLDNIEGVKDTSRLGCQLYFGPSLDGAVIDLPEIVDLRES